jgi:hypothetical protein
VDHVLPFPDLPRLAADLARLLGVA